MTPKKSTKQNSVVNSHVKTESHGHSHTMGETRAPGGGHILRGENPFGGGHVLGGENISLKKLLTILGIISGRKAIRIPVSAGPARVIAAAVEFLANHATHRPPTATVEGVRIASWSKPLSIEKSRRDLGYAPRPIGPALERAIASIIGLSP